jgi:DNA polymerase III sliding clamp (beta) subunit (PCNA family)
MEHSRVIPRVVRAVALAAAKDDYRPVLKSVQLDKEAATSADGWMLATAPVPEGEPILVSSDIGKAIDKKYKEDEPTLEWDGDGETATLTSATTSVKLGRLINSPFPNYKDLIPETRKSHMVTLNVAKLAQVVAILKEAGAETVRIQLNDSPSQSVRFDGRVPLAGTIITVVLMPVTNEESSEVDKLLKEAKRVEANQG